MWGVILLDFVVSCLKNRKKKEVWDERETCKRRERAYKKGVMKFLFAY